MFQPLHARFMADFHQHSSFLPFNPNEFPSTSKNLNAPKHHQHPIIILNIQRSIEFDRNATKKFSLNERGITRMVKGYEEGDGGGGWGFEGLTIVVLSGLRR